MIDGSLQEAGKPDETGDESSPCEVDDRGASDVIEGSLQEAGPRGKQRQYEEEGR